MNETIMVAGGAGFIGSWLCQGLLDKGYNVIAVDNFITGKPENIKHLKTSRNFKFINHDITKPLQLKKLDFIFHLASPASPVDYQKRPIETMMANSNGTLNMLKLAKKNNAKFLFTSTSEVYGDPKEHPQRETYWGNVNPNGPRSCYDESKRFAEALIVSYSTINNIDYKIARIFNTYGPRMRVDDGRVVPNFVMQALKNENVTVYGDGYQTRSFCSVRDTVDGLIRLMLSGEHGPINIGNPEERTIRDMAKRIIKLTGSSSKLTHTSLPRDDPMRRKPDITFAKAALGWQPTTKFDDGMKEAIEYFRTQL
ncbi:MAG: UDP-glucuronic acid decarboxylase family protein [Candidatus Aenigmatarchaeota archaeon]